MKYVLSTRRSRKPFPEVTLTNKLLSHNRLRHPQILIVLLFPLFLCAQGYPKAIASNMKQFKAWSDRAAKSDDETTRTDYAKRAEKYLGYAKKKAPDYDFSKEQQQIDAILGGQVTLSGKSFIRQQRGLMTSYYNEGNFFSHEAFLRPKLLEDVKKFDREKSLQTLAEMGDSPDAIVQDFKKMVNDYSDFIDRTKTREFFMTKLNNAGGQARAKNPAHALRESKKFKTIFEALQIFAGEPNATLTELTGIADQMIAQSTEELKAVVTSDFHMEHIGEILFSNKPVKIGSESAADFKEVFEPGEPIYATMYLGLTLEALFDADAISKKGVYLTPFDITEGGYSVMGPNEGWEISMFMAKQNICYPAAQLGNSYHQFILVPDKGFNIQPYVDVSNYSPVTFMHGLSRITTAMHEFAINTTKPTSGGVVEEYKGNFKLDMSKGVGKKYYNAFKEEIIYEYIKNVPWPVEAVRRDPGLEAQAMKIMGGMIGDTEFKAARITRDWDVEVVNGVRTRSIELAVASSKGYDPSNPKSGFCQYRVYTFVDTGSGLQRKSSGPITRITCDKL